MLDMIANLLIVLFACLVADLYLKYKDHGIEDKKSDIDSFADLMSQVDKLPPELQAALLAYWEKKQ